MCLYAQCTYDQTVFPEGKHGLVHLFSRLDYFYSSSVVSDLSYTHCASEHTFYRMSHTVIICAMHIERHLQFLENASNSHMRIAHMITLLIERLIL